ncbi:hypothetical protein N7528_001321 [Penicillium herquei]|nr:hypothetical protein N7528_001321 [Penicillium herquei]
MVLLRLHVRVFPREQAPNQREGLTQSVLRTTENEDDKQSFVGFLLLVEKPEDYTLHDLAWLIKEKWGKLRPHSEPLVIKKLLDDSMPHSDLDIKLSVADVFINRGKAETDGFDQSGIVRVIQKPAIHAPTRFPSVVQDFDGPVASRGRRQSPIFSPISEEPHEPYDSPSFPAQRLDLTSETPTLPMNISNDYSNPPTSSYASVTAQSRKRSLDSTENNRPPKEPRLGTVVHTARNTTPPPQPTRGTLQRPPRIPTFARPNPKLSYSKPHGNGLGLDPSTSPKARRRGSLTNIPSTDFNSHVSGSSPPPLPVISTTLSQTPRDRRHIQDRHVTFSDSPMVQKPPRSSLASSQISITPSQQGSVVFPQGVSADKIQQLQARAQEKIDLLEEARAMQEDPNIENSLRSLASEICSIDTRLKRPKSSFHVKADAQKKLDELLRRFKETKKMIVDESPTSPLSEDYEENLQVESSQEVDQQVVDEGPHNLAEITPEPVHFVTEIQGPLDQMTAVNVVELHLDSANEKTADANHTNDVAQNNVDDQEEDQDMTEADDRTQRITAQEPTELQEAPEERSFFAEEERQLMQELASINPASQAIIGEKEDSVLSASESESENEDQDSSSASSSSSEEDGEGDDSEPDHVLTPPPQPSANVPSKANASPSEQSHIPTQVSLKNEQRPLRIIVSEQRAKLAAHQEKKPAAQHTTSTGDKLKKVDSDRESSSSSSSSSEEDSSSEDDDDSEPDPISRLPPPPAPTSSTIKAIASSLPRALPSTQQSSPSRDPPKTETRLQAMLREKKAELAARLERDRAPPRVPTPPPKTRSIYELSSSDSESDSDMGDVQHNGTLDKLRRPRH